MTAPMSREAFRLDAVCVGPQRTASSWLHGVLTAHPDLCFPRGVKETLFFDERFDHGPAWYEWHFRHRRPGQRCVEIAPTYFDHEMARARLAAHRDGLRVIVTARNPAVRAFSLYCLHLAKGRVHGSFAEAVEQMPRILTSGRYARYCPAWETTFGPDRVHYTLQEDMQAEPAEAIAAICAFLEVPPLRLPPFATSRHRDPRRVPRFPWLVRSISDAATMLRGWRLHGLVNLGKRVGLRSLYRAGGEPPPSLTPELYADLASRFARDITFLEARLRRDLSHWRTFPSGQEL